MKVKKYDKGGILPPAIRALKKRASKKEAPIYGGVLDEVTVTSTKLDKKKGVGEIVENIADDLNSKTKTTGKAKATGYVASGKKSASKVMKKAKKSPRMKALKRIAKRTAKAGSALVAPPMLINPLKLEREGISNKDNSL